MTILYETQDVCKNRLFNCHMDSVCSLFRFEVQVQYNCYHQHLLRPCQSGKPALCSIIGLPISHCINALQYMVCNDKTNVEMVQNIPNLPNCSKVRTVSCSYCRKRDLSFGVGSTRLNIDFFFFFFFLCFFASNFKVNSPIWPEIDLICPDYLRVS